MIENATTRYYRYDELPGDAKEAAYESWQEYWTPRADACIGQSVEEDLSSLKAALASVGCKLADWEVNLSGWGANTCRVEVDDGLSYDMTCYSTGDMMPVLESLPEARSDDYWIGEGFMERWNGGCRPKLEAMLSEMRGECSALEGEEAVAELCDAKGGALYEAYLNLAQEQADRCMSEIRDDVESFWSREGFERDDEANEWRYEEDGTFVGRA